MLSSQTKDTMTIAAMDRLLEKSFTVQYALDIDIDELGKLIYPVGFWRVRQKEIFNFLLITFFYLSEKHNISKIHVRYYEINIMMIFQIQSKVYVHYLVRNTINNKKKRIRSFYFLGVGPKMAYLSKLKYELIII
jgi:endonuclease III